MIGRVLFDEFFLNRDWPVASAVAIVLLLLLVLPIVYFQKRQAQETSEVAA
jgi:putrescine transport system permease protein